MLRGLLRLTSRSSIPPYRFPRPYISHSTRFVSTLQSLRPYQIECVNAVLQELKRGTHTRLSVSAPTGSGKTSIFTHLISLLPSLHHPSTDQLATRVLIIVNSIQLAHQTHLAIEKAYPDLSLEIEQGTKHQASGRADVTIATFQTLGRQGGKRLDKFETEHFKAVIVDEAHHAVAKSYLSILSRFDSQISDSLASNSPTLFDSSPLASPITSASSPSSPAQLITASPGRTSEDEEGTIATLPSSAPPPIPMKLDDLGRPRVPLLGFSATMSRNDGLALGKVFEKIVWHAEWLDMIKSNWLSELRFSTLRISPSEGMNLENVEISRDTGEFLLGSLAREVDREEVNEIAVKTWMEKAADRRSTLVFAISIAHILSLSNTFRKHGIDAKFVYQETKPAERQEIYEGFRRGDFKVLVNCGILTEGADFPAIDCILLLRPTRSQTLFLQMLGRGLRLSPETGKKDCLVIDLVGSGGSAGGVVCTPTLFGVDPDADIESQSTSDLRRMKEKQPVQTELSTADTTRSSSSQDMQIEYEEYQTAFDYVSSSGGQSKEGEESSHISRLSKLAWIGCGDDTWVLELLGVGHVKIVKTADGFTASLYRKLPPTPFHHLSLSQAPPSPYMAPRSLAVHSSLAQLLKSTDRYLTSKPEFAVLGLARNAPWRRRPISLAQGNFLLKKLNPAGSGERKIEGIWVGKKIGDLVNVDELTKGQASDLISRTKHGGMSHVRKMKRGFEKGVREQLRVDGKKERERSENRRVGRMLREELEGFEEKKRSQRSQV